MEAGREGESKSPRAVGRCHEAGRLDEQIWTLVFEALWPVAERSTRLRAVDAGAAPAEPDGTMRHAAGA